MANIVGTGGSDWIRVPGDPNNPPVGYNHIPLATPGDDSIDGGAGDDVIYAGNGNDTIAGGQGNDSVFGEGGNDLIVVGPTGPSDLIDGGAGFDTLLVDNTGLGAPAQFFGANIASIEAITFGGTVIGSGPQSLNLLFNDIGTRLPANLNINGGAQRDQLVLLVFGGGTYTVPGTLVFNNWNQPPFSWVTSDRLVLFATDNAAYTLNGGATGESLVGGDSNDTLNGNGGEDYLEGKGGIDHFFGGDGNDFINTNSDVLAPNYVLETYSGGGGFDLLGFGGVTTFNGVVDSIEGIAFSNTAPTFLTADLAAYQTFGNATQAPRVLGVFGIKQVVNVNITAAGVSDLSAWIFDYWEPANPVANPNGGNLDNLIVNGSTGADSIIGTPTRDAIYGNNGNDTLNGGPEADLLAGGTGNDTYVNPAGDAIMELAGEGTDTVQSDVSFDMTLFDHVERLFLTGSAVANATGNGVANTIIGNAAANDLVGRDGNDTVQGGGGADTVNGGLGADRLVGGLQRDKLIAGNDAVQDVAVLTVMNDSSGVTRDVLTGFDFNGEDRIDLPVAPTAIAAPILAGTLSTATFNADLAAAIGAAQMGAGQAVLFDPNAGQLNQAGMVYLVVDANGVAGYQANQDWVFQLENHTGTIDTSDFI